MFIGGLCKVKISSPRPTRRKEKIPDGNCRGTRTALKRACMYPPEVWME